MIIVTGDRYDEALTDRNFEKILFPEYGKNREKLREFVNKLKGDEVIVTASLELIDLILKKFQGEGHVLIYSNTGKGSTFKEAYELRKYLDFDLRGAEITNTEKVSVLFCEGKTDSKFFKASYKKIFGFKEAREVPPNLVLIEKLFERDNYELIKNNGYIAIIPVKGTPE